MKEVVLDTETTGISIKDGHRIVEIGCIELDNLVPTKNKFHCYLNPERKVSEKALEIHGYTDDFLDCTKTNISFFLLILFSSNRGISKITIFFFLFFFKKRFIFFLTSI